MSSNACMTTDRTTESFVPENSHTGDFHRLETLSMSPLEEYVSAAEIMGVMLGFIKAFMQYVRASAN